FGRDVAVREALEQFVANAGEGTAFLLVLGASGSGKSSLVRAGLLPELWVPRAVSGVGAWRLAPCHISPQRQPARPLSRARERNRAGEPAGAGSGIARTRVAWFFGRRSGPASARQCHFAGHPIPDDT